MIGASIRELADEARVFKRFQDNDMAQLSVKAKEKFLLAIHAKFK